MNSQMELMKEFVNPEESKNLNTNNLSRVLILGLLILLVQIFRFDLISKQVFLVLSREYCILQGSYYGANFSKGFGMTEAECLQFRSATSNENMSLENRLTEAEKKLEVLYAWIQRKFGNVLVKNHPNPIIIDIHQPWVKLIKLPAEGQEDIENSIQQNSQIIRSPRTRGREFVIKAQPEPKSLVFDEEGNWDALKDEPVSEPETEMHKSYFDTEEYESESELVDPLYMPSKSSDDTSPGKTIKRRSRRKLKSKPTFPCPDPNCTEEFATKKALRVHQIFRSHSQPQSKSLCSICGKQVSDSGDNMANHLRIHSSKREYKCEICGKEFKQIQSLRQHAAYHSGLKQQCNICGLTVGYKHLNRHIRNVHEQVRRFGCPKCELKFKSGSNLKYHLRTHDNPNSKKRGLNKVRENFVQKPRKSKLYLRDDSSATTENPGTSQSDSDPTNPNSSLSVCAGPEQVQNVFIMPTQLNE